jgi:hypothetical protein
MQSIKSNKPNKILTLLLARPRKKEVKGHEQAVEHAYAGQKKE